MTGKALVVAKHVVFRQALALVLEWSEGFRAAQAGSLLEAHRVLRDPDAEPDLAIVDLELPNSEGFDLINEIRDVWPQVPVLALTTSRDPERAARAKEAGADEVLTGTTSGEDLIEEVRRLGNS